MSFVGRLCYWLCDVVHEALDIVHLVLVFCGLPCLSFLNPSLVLLICLFWLWWLLVICRIRRCIFLILWYVRCSAIFGVLLRLVFLDVGVHVFPLDGLGWSCFWIWILPYDFLTVPIWFLNFLYFVATFDGACWHHFYWIHVFTLWFWGFFLFEVYS